MARNGTTVRIIFNKFPEIARKLGPAAFEIIGETLAEMDTTVQVGMGAGGSGRVYTRGSISHQASAPGAMPAVDLGNLRGSLQHEIARGKYTGYYYTTADYAPHLEYGAPGANILPRPFMTVAAERARPGFLRKMRHLESRLR